MPAAGTREPLVSTGKQGHSEPLERGFSGDRDTCDSLPGHPATTLAQNLTGDCRVYQERRQNHAPQTNRFRIALKCHHMFMYAHSSD